MKKIAVFLAAALVSASAFAEAQWVGNSYIVVNGDWYNGSGTGNAAFSNLGDLSALSLGGEMQIGDNGNDWGSGSGNWMGYRVEQNGQAVIADSWIEMAYDSYGYGEYYNNMKFKTTQDANVDISGLTDGASYDLVVWFGGVDDKWDAGNNFTASFSKAASTGDVPEPATMSLLGLGALALALRRKLRK